MKPDGTRHTLDDLRAMTCTTISNALAAEVLGMKPDRLSGYCREHPEWIKWKWMPSGNRVLHSREGFISFWGGQEQ